MPIGLFWFAWYVIDIRVAYRSHPSRLIARTADPPVHWIVPIIAGFPFGQGVCQILQSSTAYLMDAYEIYFASAIAATIVLRSIFAAVFPVIAPTMFENLGDAWGMSIFAFLGLACTPIPFLFWVSFLDLTNNHESHADRFHQETRQSNSQQIKICL